ncbi:MAG TPA: FtsX-like permease family protein [Blastocatellia bacterium]|nr:FtsX-like permease family protein [Blastocatellia bacterium]
MDNLVLSNIRQRPMRTLISVMGVALGVILIVLITGLVRGMLNERIRRDQGVGAEIQFWRGGATPLPTSNAMPLDVRYADRLKKIQGVRMVSPYGHYLQKGNSGLGFELVDGIEFDSYSAMSKLQIVEGRAFGSDDEVIIDEFRARHENKGVGSEIQVFGKTMKVTGIYSPQIGSRTKMSLAALQRALSQENKCRTILVKVEDGSAPEEVARRIDAVLPNNQVVLTSDIGLNFGRQIPAIQGFVRAVMGLSMVVSTLVILLAMYTTITERTREIGVLKSLGAPKSYIIGVIEKEALAISLIGVIAGLIVALIAAFGIERLTTLQLEFHWTWMLAAGLIGLGAGAIGALYPALRAANQDAVKALSYE